MIKLNHTNKNGTIQIKELITSLKDLKSLQITITSEDNVKLNKDSKTHLIGSFSKLGQSTANLLKADGYPLTEVFGVDSFCVNCEECQKVCFNKKNYWRSNVVNNRLKNELLSRRDGFYDNLHVAVKQFENKAISRGLKPILRLHVEGEFSSFDYLWTWLKIFKDFPNVQFYSYTKNYKLFNQNNLKYVDNVNIMVSVFEGMEKNLIQSEIFPLIEKGYKTYNACIGATYQVLSKCESFNLCRGDCVNCRNCIEGRNNAVVSIH